MKKPREILASAARRLGAALHTSRLYGLLKSVFRGGLQAALVGCWERYRKAPPNDVTHRFRARDYPGSRARRCVVHVPRNRNFTRSRPLVVVLHGCHQDNHDIEAISGFNQFADQRGFLVAYPFVTSYRGLRSKNCWGWWFDSEIHAGAGEVEDLWQIIEDVKQLYSVDERRIHVVGLSSGGGMAVAMMVAHADRIASGAVVAGVPYAERAESVRHAFNRKPRHRPVTAIVKAMRAEMGGAARLVPVHIVHSQDDDKVDIKSSELIRDSWGHCFDIDTRRPSAVESGCEDGTAWQHSRYSDDSGTSVIETLFLQGPGHGWYGGKPGKFSYPDGPDIKHAMLKFFKAHPLKP